MQISAAFFARPISLINTQITAEAWLAGARSSFLCLLFLPAITVHTAKHTTGGEARYDKDSAPDYSSGSVSRSTR